MALRPIRSQEIFLLKAIFKHLHKVRNFLSADDFLSSFRRSQAIMSTDHWSEDSSAIFGPSAASIPPSVVQLSSSSSMGISFNVEDYIGEEVSSVKEEAKDPDILESARDQLLSLMTHLESDIAALVRDAKPVRDIFDSIKEELPVRLREALLSAAHLEYHEPSFRRAMDRLADRELQKQLPNQEAKCKDSLLKLKDSVDNLKSTPDRIKKELSDLDVEKSQLLAWLEEIEASVKEKNAELTKASVLVEEQKNSLARTYSELRELHAKKQKIPGTKEENNQQIAEIDAIHQNALDTLKSFLKL